jgi:threonine/homoserine/homoserine lactone efflux protein
MALILFLLNAVVVSLTGVLSPGAITAATINEGTRNRHAGILVAVGHGIVEFPLMLLILLGMDEILGSTKLKIAIGLVGGSLLTYLAVAMLREVKKISPELEAASLKRQHPLWIGIMLTACNPLFLGWWASAGLNLVIQAKELGRLAFALFVGIHWLLDLIWLEVLSYSSYKGAKLLSVTIQKIILSLCGLILLFFAGWFIFVAIETLLE